MRASDAMVLRPAMAATVVVIAFANMMICACDLVENADMPTSRRHRVLYMYSLKPKFQLMVCVYMAQNRKTIIGSETDMQTLLECEISSKVDITKTIPIL
jgi:hypothetical protein